MNNKKGFVISTMLYSVFGIMLFIVFYILYLLSNYRISITTSVSSLKEGLEKMDTIYLNFVISDYLKDSYTKEKLTEIENQIESETFYDVEIDITYTGLSYDINEFDVEDKKILEYYITGGTIIVGSPSSVYSFYGILGDNLLIVDTTGERDKIINVQDIDNPIELSRNYFNNSNLKYNSKLYKYYAIDKINKYLYFKVSGIDDVSVGSYNWYENSTNYFRMEYDSDTYAIDSSTLSQVYQITDDSDVYCKKSGCTSFNNIQNAYYNLGITPKKTSTCAEFEITQYGNPLYYYGGDIDLCIPAEETVKESLKKLHTNPHTLPSEELRGKIYQSAKNKYNYYDNIGTGETPVYGPTYHEFTFERTSDGKHGILVDIYTTDDLKSRELHMLWYEPYNYKIEKLKVGKIKKTDYKDKYYILIKDDVYDQANIQHFDIDINLEKLKDYHKYTYTGDTTKNDITGNLGESVIYNSCYDINDIDKSCGTANNVDYTINKITSDIKDSL